MRAVCLRLFSRFSRIAPLDGDQSATSLELFFDLVYVFAFTQVIALATQSHDALAVLQSLVVLGLLWWTWANASWFANEARADLGLPRVGMILTMAVVLLVALVIPRAFRPTPSRAPALTIATGFLMVGIIFTVNWLIVTGSDRVLRRLVLRSFLTATLPSAALLVLGALIGLPWQTIIWLAAFVVDAVIIYFNLRASPRLNSARHFAERHELVLMLALGESIVSIGVSASALTLDVPVAIGVLLALSLAVALWFAYFPHLSQSAQRTLRGQKTTVRGKSAIDAYTYLHFVLITGIILTAVGIHVAVGHTAFAEFGGFGASTLNAGVALYLLGSSLFSRRMHGRWLIVRVFGAVVLVGLIPVSAVAAPSIATLVATFVVAGALTLEYGIAHRHRLPNVAQVKNSIE
jgi:low temperature requirement protein LtrA